jgi:hypothetical protein
MSAFVQPAAKMAPHETVETAAAVKPLSFGSPPCLSRTYCRRGLMYHMSRAWNAPQGTLSYITMQLGGLLHFTHLIFRACNDDHGHLEISVGLSEAVRFMRVVSAAEARI